MLTRSATEELLRRWMKLVRRVVRKRWRGEVEVEVAIEKVQQNTAQRQQFEAAYQQTCGAIATLYVFATSPGRR